MSTNNNEISLTTSKKLIEIQKKLPKENITLKQLIDTMSAEGIQLLIILLLAPFLIPASIPGSSTPFGILIIILEISFLLNKPLYIPNFIGSYEVSKEMVIKFFQILKRTLGYVEKISKPRGTLANKDHILQINALITIVLAFLLFLPLPIPFTDFTPAISILILSVSSLESDSYLMILGYIATISTIIYFLSVGYVGIEIIRLILNYIGIKL